MRTWWRTAVPVALWTLAHGAVLGTALLGLGREGSVIDGGVASLASLLAFSGIATVGLLLGLRCRENPIGWILLGVAAVLGVLLCAQEYAGQGYGGDAAPPVGALAALWLSNWLWYPALGALMIFVPLLFPTGRPPGPRWRAVGWIGGVGLALVTVNAALSERLGHPDDGIAVANPIGVPGLVAEQGPLDAVGFALIIAALLAGVASVVVRYRRSRGTERQQLKWMLSATVLLAVNMASDPLGMPTAVSAVLFPLSMAALPVAIGVAILRYRLYEIDRIISRTVAYAIITAVLGGLYAGAVLLLGSVAGGGSELAVAGSTLLVAAAFGPVRRRVQTLVDRRFNRARYDAQRTVESFAARLRDEVQLDELSRELAAIVQRSVAPATVSVWVREASR